MLYRVYFCVWLLSLAFQEAILIAGGYSFLRYALPLHLCSYSALIGLASMLSKRLRSSPCVRRFLLLLGCPGALSAMLFPSLLPSEFPLLSLLSFYLAHTMLLLCPLVLMKEAATENKHERLYSALPALILTALACAANALFSANYLFLVSLPEPLMLLSFLPQFVRPIICFILFAALLMLPIPTILLKGRRRGADT